MIKLIILRSTIATIVAWAGGITGALIGGKVRSRLIYLVCAALGALLAVTIFDILPDALALLSMPEFAAATGSGLLLFWLVARYVYPICPACALPGGAAKPVPDLARTVTLLMIALGLHSTMDGAAVVIGDSLTHGANAAVFFAVSLHKFPEGLALVLLLIGAGMKRSNALLCTLAIETTTELGALGAVVLVHRLSTTTVGLIFANIGGGFLYLVLAMLLSERQEAHVGGRKLTFGSAVSGGVGFAATCGIIALSSALAH